MTPELTQEQILLEVQKLRRERDLYMEALERALSTCSPEYYGPGRLAADIACEALIEGAKIRGEG